MTDYKKILFAFPHLPGHINPSFPVAKKLVADGHEVHYLTRKLMQESVEETGAKLHTQEDVYKTLYTNREPDILGFGATFNLIAEKNLVNMGFMQIAACLEYIHVDLKLQDLVDWIKELKPDVLLYCPMMCNAEGYAAKLAGIPSVSLITVAGPGALREAYLGHIGMEGLDLEKFWELRQASEIRKDGISTVNEKFSIGVEDVQESWGMGVLDVMRFSHNLTTTAEALQVPLVEQLQAWYASGGATFEAVGPLYEDDTGRVTPRASMMNKASYREGQMTEEEILGAVKTANSAGRKVILVSLGTMITGNDETLGWEGRPVEADGTKRGITGRQLCQSAWGGCFDAVGKSRSHVGPLVVVAIGGQDNALGDLEVPENVITSQRIPQIDILRAGVDVFVAGGGQNGFTEGLTNGVPFVVAVGQGDQQATADMAEKLGVGVGVSRPNPDPGMDAEACVTYRAAISDAVEKVLNTESYKEASMNVKASFAKCGGVPRVCELLLKAAGSG